jgi:hypothetical protein
MQPSFLLAELYVQGSLDRTVYNALPGSPTQAPACRRRLRLGRRLRRAGP